MFTGIIETTGIIQEIIEVGSNRTFWVESALSSELKVDQSIAHNGVCLTIEEIRDRRYRVTAIQETLKKTNLENLQVTDCVNLERCLPVNGRLDGHFVQGHVDSTGKCIQLNRFEGSWELRISFPQHFAELIIEKGSISLNGISLTVYDVTENEFSVAIIPYTFYNTNVRDIIPGSIVNLEFDLIGKYISRIHKLENLPNE